MNSKLTYRPEIDGLRAIAVLAVVIFHLDPIWLPGGYIGVDIFFTISGFLITSIIYPQITSGNFSLRNFYLKRIMRLGPASLAVIVFTCLCGFLLLSPNGFFELAQSSFMSLLFLANYFFWNTLEINYFAPEAETLPLLHFWSLAIEEQFYIFWPVVLLFLTKKHPKMIGPCLASLIIFSLGLAIYLSSTDPMFSYFMPFTRSYQLLIGCLGAIFLHRRGKVGLPSYLIGILLGVLGAIFFWMDKSFNLPSYWALIPSIITLCLLLNTKNTATLPIKALSSKLLISIGKISYSLYLWHWPIIVFAKKIGFFDSFTQRFIVVIIFSLAATISYYFIENRFRYSTPSIKKSLSLVLVPIIFFGFFVVPFSERKVESIEAAHQDKIRKFNHVRTDRTVCWGAARFGDSKCIYPKSGCTYPDILLWGDSNAGHYVGFLKAVAEQEGRCFQNAVQPSCPPLLEGSEKYVAIEKEEECNTFQKRVKAIANNHKVHILAGQWATYNKDAFLTEFENTLKMLSQHEVYVISQVPGFKFDRECELKKISNPETTCKYRKDSFDIYKNSHTFITNQSLKQIATKFPHVHFVDTASIICNSKLCSPFNAEIDKDVPIYYNSTHLNHGGSYALGMYFKKSENFFLQ